MKTKSVDIIIDRPLGSRHPRFPDLVYPVNYGYVPGVFAPDGEEQDVYLLGVDRPVKAFRAKLIAVIRRDDDIEEKWAAAPDGVTFTADEISAAIAFQERFFHSHVILIKENESWK